MPKVLIADKMSPRAEEIFKERGIDVDVITGLERDELIKIIGEYDGMAVRSSTKATPPVLEAAGNMKVIVKNCGVTMFRGTGSQRHDMTPWLKSLL